MSSFEELLAQSRVENTYQPLYERLLQLVLDKDQHWRLCNKLQPFLHHVSDSSLNALHVQLQNPFVNMDHMRSMYQALVHNVINSCRYNDKLLEVIKVVC